MLGVRLDVGRSSTERWKLRVLGTSSTVNTLAGAH
jgi:hypothetical protein